MEHLSTPAMAGTTGINAVVYAADDRTAVALSWSRDHRLV